MLFAELQFDKIVIWALKDFWDNLKKLQQPPLPIPNNTYFGQLGNCCIIPVKLNVGHETSEQKQLQDLFVQVHRLSVHLHSFLVHLHKI